MIFVKYFICENLRRLQGNNWETKKKLKGQMNKQTKLKAIAANESALMPLSDSPPNRMARHHTSHIMHVWDITLHQTSHITRGTSHIKCHASLFRHHTDYTSHIMHHASLITHDTSHIICISNFRCVIPTLCLAVLLAGMAGAGIFFLVYYILIMMSK